MTLSSLFLVFLCARGACAFDLLIVMRIGVSISPPLPRNIHLLRAFCKFIHLVDMRRHVLDPFVIYSSSQVVS